MKYEWTYMRDRIVIDNDWYAKFRDKINGVAAGSTILFAARVIQIRTNIEFADVDLVFLADEFDGSQGNIKTTVNLVPPDGNAGYPGRNITLAVKSIRGLRVELVGGAGGKGLEGNPGKDGKKGKNEPGKVDGGDGEKGGKGKPGGTGGSGGRITLNYIQDNVPGGVGGATTSLLVPGGKGGPGGSGGKGGQGGEPGTWCKPHSEFCVDGEPGKDGPTGDVGDFGLPGPSGIVQLQAAKESDFWSLVQTLSPEWADYRLQVGEYFYRILNHNAPDGTPIDLAMAYREFLSVLAINPAATQAQSYINQILANQNFGGLSRDLDIRPDFDRYENIYTKYYPLVEALFNSAEVVLNRAKDLTVKRAELQQRYDDMAALASSLEDEVKASQVGQVLAEQEIERAQAMHAANTQRLEQLKDELGKAQVDIAGAIVGTVGLVASILAAIPTAGSSLVGAAASVFQIAKAITDSGLDSLVAEAFKSKKEDRVLIPKLEKDAGDLVKYIKDVEKAVATIASFDKIMEQLWSAKIDSAKQQEYRELLAKTADLSHAVLLGSLHKEQADFGASASKKRLENAKRSRDSLEKLKNEFTDTSDQQRKDVAFALLKQAQHFGDILQNYRYFALRAAEIYALLDLTEQIRFDRGHLHPDLQRDYDEGFILVETLLSHLRNSWGGLSDVIQLRKAYDDYFGQADYVPDIERISLNSPDVLKDFRRNREIALSLRPEDLLNDRLEAHLESVFVSLIGAKSLSGVVSVRVEHFGKCTYELRQKKKEITLVLNPHEAIAIAGFKPLGDQASTAIGTTRDAGFWGKGIIARWRIRIEDDEMKKNQVDLSNLQEIQIWVQYKSFIRSSLVTRSREPIRDGLILQDEETKRKYWYFSGGRFPIDDSQQIDTSKNDSSTVDELPSAWLNSIPTVICGRRLIKASGSGALYVVMDGVKSRVSDKSKFSDALLMTTESLTVPDEIVNSFPTSSDGT